MNEQEKENITNDIVDELHCRSQIGGIIHSDRFRVVAESLVKKLNLHFVNGRSEQLAIKRCECEVCEPTEIKICTNCDGYIE